MKLLLKLIPWGVAALFVAEIVAVMVPKKDAEYHVREFGRLPVLLGGRIQPFDSLGRNSLLQIRSTGDVPLEEVPSWKFWHHPKKLKSTEWLLELMTRPETADKRPAFLIHHPELLGELKLENKGIEKSGLRYYTFDELRGVASEILEQGKQAGEVKAELQTPFQKQVSKLANAIMIYHRLKHTLQPEAVDGWSQELAEFRTNLAPARAAAHEVQSGKEANDDALKRIAGPFRQFQEMATFSYALVVPPWNPQTNRDGWVSAGASLLESARTEQFHPAVLYLADIATAYRAENPIAFNQAVAAYRGWLEKDFPREASKGRAEFYYNNVKAFLHADIMYISALVLGCVSLLCFSLGREVFEVFRRSAFYVIVVAGVVHTFGLIFRMMLEGRPPVTNLYSSAIFIGWGAMILGIVLEKIYKIGIGNIVAATAGFITLLIAHNLAIGGDTMEMLRAVLDTNFWLATHVVVVTLGYATTFVAGLLAIIYIGLGVFTPMLKDKLQMASGAQIDIGKALSKMVYGIVCFATLFSFTGTVLGGIWATCTARPR